MEDVQQELQALAKFYEIVIDFVVNYSFQVIGALLILAVGAIVSRYAARLLLDMCEKRNVDITLSKFLSSVVRILIFALFVIISLGKFGITLAPFIAAIGAVFFGASLAVQGLLSNYAAGLTLILARYFKVGDTITVQGVSGVVEEIKLAMTFLSTEDGEVITIPNKLIVGEILQNSFEFKVVEMVIGIDYADDPALAKSVIEGVLTGRQDVATDPKPQVGVDTFGESSIDIGFRYWVPMKSYYQSRYSANLAVFQSLKDAGISVPFPRRDVTMLPGSQPAA